LHRDDKGARAPNSARPIDKIFCGAVAVTGCSGSPQKIYQENDAAQAKRACDAIRCINYRLSAQKIEDLRHDDKIERPFWPLRGNGGALKANVGKVLATPARVNQRLFCNICREKCFTTSSK
jgi:hypothetical protein